MIPQPIRSIGFAASAIILTPVLLVGIVCLVLPYAIYIVLTEDGQ